MSAIVYQVVVSFQTNEGKEVEDLIGSDHLNEVLKDLMDHGATDRITTKVLHTDFTRIFMFNYLGVWETACIFGKGEIAENLAPLKEVGLKDDLGNQLYSHPSTRSLLRIDLFSGLWLPPVQLGDFKQWGTHFPDWVPQLGRGLS